jgi:hypothetical protein
LRLSTLLHSEEYISECLPTKEALQDAIDAEEQSGCLYFQDLVLMWDDLTLDSKLAWGKATVSASRVYKQEPDINDRISKIKGLLDENAERNRSIVFYARLNSRISLIKQGNILIAIYGIMLCELVIILTNQ